MGWFGNSVCKCDGVDEKKGLVFIGDIVPHHVLVRGLYWFYESGCHQLITLTLSYREVEDLRGCQICCHSLLSLNSHEV